MSNSFALELEQIENYRFEIRFDSPSMPALRHGFSCLPVCLAFAAPWIAARLIVPI